MSRYVDPRLKLELLPKNAIVGEGGVEQWRSIVGGHVLSQTTPTARPAFSPGEGLYFDGGDALGGAILTINTRAAWTIEWWQYELSQSGFQTPFYLYNPAIVYVSFNGASIYLSDGVTNTISGASMTRSLNEWVHYAASFDAATYFFHRNGSQVASSTTLLAAGNVSNLHLQAFDGVSNWINGRMSDFRIFTSCIYPNGITFNPPPRSQLALPTPPMSSSAVISAAALNNSFQFKG